MQTKKKIDNDILSEQDTVWLYAKYSSWVKEPSYKIIEAKVEKRTPNRLHVSYEINEHKYKLIFVYKKTKRLIKTDTMLDQSYALFHTKEEAEYIDQQRIKTEKLRDDVKTIFNNKINSLRPEKLQQIKNLLNME